MVSHHSPLANVQFQILATFAGNIILFGIGCNFGWFSPSLPTLMSADRTPLDGGPLTNDQVGWIGAAPSLGAMLGAMLYGLLANHFGYRNAILMTFIPITMSWLLIVLAENVWYICVARFLVGASGGGAYLCIPGFVAEIADDHIRGQLNSYMQVSLYSGVLAGYVGGTYLNYETNPMVMAIVPFVFVALFLAMPNSPQYWLRLDRVEKAERALEFYRNSRSGHLERKKQVRKEFEKLQAIAMQNEHNPKLLLGDFVSKESLRAFTSVLVLLSVLQLSGSYIISSFAATIFQRTGSTIDANVSSIVMGALQVAGTYVGSHLIDRVGRKTLLTVSMFGATMSHATTATFVYLNTSGHDVRAFNALPIVSISFFIFINAIGMLNVPYVLMAELMPAKIRRVGSTICIMLSFLVQFGMLRVFPNLMDEFELHGCMFFFACVTTFGLVYTVVVLEETNGKSLDALIMPADTTKDVKRSEATADPSANA